MKFFLNILPAVCFYLTYKLSGGDLIYATAAILISSIISFLGCLFLYKKITRFQIIFILLLVVFAVPTIVIKDPDIIKWKVSVVNTFFALAILVCQYGFKKNIVDTVFDARLPLPQKLITKFTWVIVGYFIACALLNYIIAFKLPSFTGFDFKQAEDIWVNYKTWGNGLFNFVFMIFLFCWGSNQLSAEQKTELQKVFEKISEQNMGINLSSKVSGDGENENDASGKPAGEVSSDGDRRL